MRNIQGHCVWFDYDYKGDYQAINQLFLESMHDGFTVVNREQDLDDPGLRKAKESYQPTGFHEKFELHFNKM